jgi:hypothetical protein
MGLLPWYLKSEPEHTTGGLRSLQVGQLPLRPALIDAGNLTLQRRSGFSIWFEQVWAVFLGEVSFEDTGHIVIRTNPVAIRSHHYRRTALCNLREMETLIWCVATHIFEGQLARHWAAKRGCIMAWLVDRLFRMKLVASIPVETSPTREERLAEIRALLAEIAEPVYR